MRPLTALAFLCAATLGLACWAAAQERVANATTNQPTAAPAVASETTARSGAAEGSTSAPAKNPEPAHTDLPLRIEGERRFRANCGRCHVAPQKYSARVAATTIRHMRVRATLTDEDMRYILAYITQ